MKTKFIVFLLSLFVFNLSFGQASQALNEEKRDAELDAFFKKHNATASEKLNTICELSLLYYQYNKKDRQADLEDVYKSVFMTYRVSKKMDYTKRLFEVNYNDPDYHIHTREIDDLKLDWMPSKTKPIGGDGDYDKLSTCNNSDFEMGDEGTTVTGWQLAHGSYSGGYPNGLNWTSNTANLGPMNSTSGQHCIMGPGAGADAQTNNAMQRVYPGGGAYSLRVGDQGTGAKASKASYTFTVTPQTELFIYNYAVVFQDPGHAPSQQPFLAINLIINGSLTDPCGAYQQMAASGIPGYQNGSGSVRYKNWETVSVSLTAYMNQTATIEFITADCSPSAHFGYAYIDAECMPMPSLNDVDINCFDPTPTLHAPPGANGYQWTGPGIIGPNNLDTAVVNAPGTYTVTVIPVSGPNCAYTLNLNVTEHLGTITGTYTAIPDSTCLGNGINLSSSFTTTGDAGAVDVVSWDFSDGGGGATGQNPTYTYTDPGVYSVVMSVITMNGCTDTVTQNVTIHPLPEPGFQVGAVCEGSNSVILDTSSIISTWGDNIVDWAWDFGDGTTVNGQNPSHTFATENTYNVTLTLTSNNGCTNSITEQVVVYPNATVNFNDGGLCEDDTKNFLDQSTVSNNHTTNNIVDWSWDFGDGNNSTDQNPSHDYAGEGVYNVTLTVTTDNGCPSTVTLPVSVYPNPIVGTTPSEACLGQTSLFNDNSTVSNDHTSNNIVTWNWNFQDGTSSNAQNTTHTYSSDGTYYVVLTVTTDHGCTATDTVPVIIYPNPTALFTTNSVCEGADVLISDASFPDPNNGGVITDWFWDWGDGQTGTGQNATHSFTNENIYNVTLTVETDHGCRDSVTIQTTIYPNPVVDFNYNEICFGNTTVFSDATTLSNTYTTNNITDWSWDLGDGSTSSNQNPTNTYANDGQYNVTLTVYTDNGCSSIATYPVWVYPIPKADFYTDDREICPSNCANMVSTSTVGSPSVIANYQWTFSDGTVYNTSDPNFIKCFENQTDGALIYDVDLVITSNHGCMDSIGYSDYITVHNDPIAGFYYEPDFPDMIESGVDFINTSQNADSYVWNIGGLTSLTSENVYYNFPGVPNTYYVELIAITGNGCKDTMIIEVPIIAPEMDYKFPNVFTPNDDADNDYFHLISSNLDKIQAVRIVILNRWGNVVFESSEVDFAWNGQVNNTGSECTDGVYFYKAELIDFKGQSFQEHGFFHLVRK